MTGESVGSSQNLAQEQSSFNIGVDKNSQKQKTKTAEELVEKRSLEMFAGNIGESTKRQREEYAVKIRKAER